MSVTRGGANCLYIAVNGLSNKLFSFVFIHRRYKCGLQGGKAVRGAKRKRNQERGYDRRPRLSGD